MQICALAYENLTFKMLYETNADQSSHNNFLKNFHKKTSSTAEMA